MNEDLVVGLMSGTSLDGVDGVLVSFGPDVARGERQAMQVLAHAHAAFNPTLRAELLALNASADNELHRAALAANALAHAYAAVVSEVLERAGVPRERVRALGAHGQTVRHRPGEFDGTGYTLQLINGALLAELTDIDVVCDLRSRDVAAGGQGAPLVPAFHAARFSRAGCDRAVLNLGGIANLSLLPADASVRGFDCGPGNVLLDLWSARCTGRPYDADGGWAATGRVRPDWLTLLLDEPFLRLAPPKSTGRDLFHARWLDERRQRAATALSDADTQATLAEFTARAAADALRQHLPGARDLLVCGGGAFNTDLLSRLSRLLPGTAVRSTADEGLPPDQVEAAAFAWLARAFMRRQPGNRPEVTGARGLRVLGALYPRA